MVYTAYFTSYRRLLYSLKISFFNMPIPKCIDVLGDTEAYFSSKQDIKNTAKWCRLYPSNVCFECINLVIVCTIKLPMPLTPGWK